MSINLSELSFWIWIKNPSKLFLNKSFNSIIDTLSYQNYYIFLEIIKPYITPEEELLFSSNPSLINSLIQKLIELKYIEIFTLQSIKNNKSLFKIYIQFT